MVLKRLWKKTTDLSLKPYISTRHNPTLEVIYMSYKTIGEVEQEMKRKEQRVAFWEEHRQVLSPKMMEA